MKTIYTPNAPEPIGPYSQAIQSGDFLFCSGQIAMDPRTGALPESDIQGQTRRACANIGGILEAADMSFENVVKTVCYLTNADDFGCFNEIYSQYFKNSPARSCVFVAALPKKALVELEVTACKTKIDMPIIP